MKKRKVTKQQSRQQFFRLMPPRFIIALLFALCFDLADYVAFAWIPFVGDILDGVAILVLLPLIRWNALLGVAEFIPFFDFVPTYTLIVLLSLKQWQRNQWKKPPANR